jgi:hypothetical protein
LICIYFSTQLVIGRKLITQEKLIFSLILVIKIMQPILKLTIYYKCPNKGLQEMHILLKKVRGQSFRLKICLVGKRFKTTLCPWPLKSCIPHQGLRQVGIY